MVKYDDVLVEYDVVKDLYVLLMQFAFLKDWKTAAQRLCCERELLGVAASVGIHERLPSVGSEAGWYLLDLVAVCAFI